MRMRRGLWLGLMAAIAIGAWGTSWAIDIVTPGSNPYQAGDEIDSASKIEAQATGTNGTGAVTYLVTNVDTLSSDAGTSVLNINGVYEGASVWQTAILHNQGEVNNLGAINVNSLGQIFNSGTFNNSGTISLVDTATTYGLAIFTNQAYVYNTGTITFDDMSSYVRGSNGIVVNSDGVTAGEINFSTALRNGIGSAAGDGFQDFVESIADGLTHPSGNSDLGTVNITISSSSPLAIDLDFSGATDGVLSLTGDLDGKNVLAGNADLNLGLAVDGDYVGGEIKAGNINVGSLTGNPADNHVAGATFDSLTADDGNNGGSINVTTVTAGSNGISVTGDVKAGNSVTMKAGDGNVVIDGNVEGVNGVIDLAGSNIILGTDEDNTVTAKGNITLTAADNGNVIVVGDAITSTDGKITASGENVLLGTTAASVVSAATGIEVAAMEDAAALGALEVTGTGNVVITAGAGNLAPPPAAGREIAITGAITTADGNVSLGNVEATRITVGGDISAAGAVSLTTGDDSNTYLGNITAKNISASDAVVASAAGALSVDNVESTGAGVSLAGVAGTTVFGTVDAQGAGASGNINIGNTNSNTVVKGTITALDGSDTGGAIALNGANIGVGEWTVSGDVYTVTKKSDVIADADIAFNTVGSVGISGEVISYAGKIDVTGAGNHVFLDEVSAATAINANGITTFMKDVESVTKGATPADDVLTNITLGADSKTDFRGNVYGNIVSNGELSNVRGNHIGDLTVATGTTHIMDVDSSFSGGSIDNSGTLGNNSQAGGILIEDGETFANKAGASFINDGGVLFEENAVMTNAGAILNKAYDETTGIGGKMVFDDRSEYKVIGTDGYVDNRGVIFADIDMANDSLAALAANTVMRTDSEFFIANYDSTGDHILDYDVIFADANTEQGSRVTLQALNLGLGNTSIDIDGAKIYAGNADLSIQGSTVVAWASDVELFDGSILATSKNSLKGFTAELNSSLWVNDGTSWINAPKATFEDGTTLGILGNTYLVYESNNAVLGGGVFKFEDGANFSTDTYDLLWNDTTYLGKLVIRGDSTVAGDTADLVIGSNVTLDIDGERRYTVGEWVVSYDGDRTGTFVNDDYLLYYDDFGTVAGDGIGKVYVAWDSNDSVVDILDDMYDLDFWGSINKVNGAFYTDDMFADPTTDMSTKFNVGASIAAFERIYYDDLNPHLAWVGFGQLIGEYGAYSTQLLRESNQFFWNSESQRFSVKQNARISSNQGGYFGAAQVRPEDAYAVVRGRNGGFDVCKSIFTVWAEGFGAWSRQKSRQNLHGYNYNSGGFNVGIDYTVGRFDFSLFGGYTNGTLKLKDLATKYDADIMNLGLTAAYTHESGFYGKAMFGYGHGWNDYDTQWVLGGKYHGSFKNHSWTAGAEIGYIAQTSFMNIIPSVGLMYTHYSQKAWSESFSGGAIGVPHWFKKQRLNTVEIPVGLRLNKVFCFGTTEIAPEIRTAWIYSAKRDRAKINMGYMGDAFSTTMYGVDPGRSRWLIGGGVKARFNQNWDANLDYNFTVRRKYTTHNVTASIGYSF